MNVKKPSFGQSVSTHFVADCSMRSSRLKRKEKGVSFGSERIKLLFPSLQTPEANKTRPRSVYWRVSFGIVK